MSFLSLFSTYSPGTFLFYFVWIWRKFRCFHWLDFKRHPFFLIVSFPDSSLRRSLKNKKLYQWMLSGESENFLVGDVCSGKSSDSCGEDNCVSVLRGLSQPTLAWKYMNPLTVGSEAWNENISYRFETFLMLLETYLLLHRHCLTFSFTPTAHLATDLTWD